MHASSLLAAVLIAVSVLPSLAAPLPVLTTSKTVYSGLDQLGNEPTTNTPNLEPATTPLLDTPVVDPTVPITPGKAFTPTQFTDAVPAGVVKPNAIRVSKPSVEPVVDPEETGLLSDVDSFNGASDEVLGFLAEHAK